MNKTQKEFDRSVCFTFYNSFHEQIMDVKRDFGLEQAFEVYEAIVNCGLYGKEIEKGKLRTLVGNTTIEKVEGSQENRAKWFNGENFEQTRLVAEYMRDHPNTSQRTIAAATGVGKTKVGKVQKNIRESEFDNIQDYLTHIVYPHLNVNDNGNSCNSGNDSDNNIVSKSETDQRDQSSQSKSHTETASHITEATLPTPTPTELTYEEEVAVIKAFQKRQKPIEISKELSLDFGLVNLAIDEYKDRGYKLPPKPEEVKTLDVPLMNGGYHSQTKEELFNDATDNGKSDVDDVAWDSLRDAYIMMGISPTLTEQLLEEFEARLLKKYKKIS